jgi:hypothetical protein
MARALDRRRATCSSRPRVSTLLPSDEAARGRRDRVLLWIACLLAVVLVVRAASKQDGVLVRNQDFGARFLRGEDPYFDPVRGVRLHGPYPPSYALVTVPLSLLSTTPARVVWASMQIGALVAGFVLVRRWLRRAWPEIAPHSSVVYALALLLASRFALRDMAGGGGNLLYAISALWGLELALARRDIAAGFLLALPLVLKPNLAPLALVLPCLGRWRALAATLTWCVLLFFAPALVYGVDAYGALALRWSADVGSFANVTDMGDAAQVPSGFPVSDTTMNQSLREALDRALGGAHELAAWCARCAAIALLAVGAWAVVRARSARAELLAALAFVPISLLISPISWKAHHAALLPLFALLVAVALDSRRRWLQNVLVVYYMSCVLLSEELVGKDWKNTLQAVSVVTWGAIALFVAAIVLSRSERESNDARQLSP